MDQGLKERLIGAAVLVALAVWLIPWVLDGPDQPIPEDAEPLRLPVPSGHVGEVRTEVIDLSQRRLADEASPNVSSDARPAAGAERRTEPATAAAPVTTPAGAAESPSSSSASLSPGSGGEAAAASQAPARSSAAETGGETTVAKAESPASASTPAPAQTSSSSSNDRPATASTAVAAASRTAPAPSGDWAVQLGSFGDEDNARRLAERVAALGHSPRITPYRTGGRTMYRVRVGPHATREAAEAAASALAARGFPAQVVTVE